MHAYLAAFVQAWGFGPLKDKFHWLLHLARELDIHKTLYACWVHERKHKVTRRYGDPIQNTSTWEHTVLSELTAHHLAALRNNVSLSFQPGILFEGFVPQPIQKAIAAELGLSDPGLVSGMCKASRINEFEVCHTQDIVLIKDGDGDLGQIWREKT